MARVSDAVWRANGACSICGCGYPHSPVRYKVLVKRTLIAVASGLALADAAVVVLALPSLLLELDTTVEGVAAVIAVYTRAGDRPAAGAALHGRATGAAGALLFAAASLGCAAADSLEFLLLDARAPGDRGVGAARGRVRRARRRRQRTPPVARRGGGRHGRRPRARRHSDRGIRLAGDLPRAGTDRAGGRAGALRHTDCDRARAPAAAAQGRARGDRAHPAVRSAYRGRVPACPVADQRLERRPAGGGRGGHRPAAGRGGRVVHPRRACDARRRRLSARGRGHRVPGPAAGGLGLVDDRPSAARRCGDGHGVSGTRRRAASRAHPRAVRSAALPAPRRHHARPRRACPDRGRRARPAGRPGTRARHRARARRRAAPHRQDRACSAPIRRHGVREPARRARAGDDARAPQGRARGPRLP